MVSCADATPPGRCAASFEAVGPAHADAVALARAATDEVTRMFVASEWPGGGVGRRLLAELERAAAELGCELVRLDTGDRQLAALALYRSAGNGEIQAYNVQPGALHWTVTAD